MIMDPHRRFVHSKLLSGEDFYAKLRTARGRSCLLIHIFDIFAGFAFRSFSLNVVLPPASVRRQP